jgi:hypothetical protein
VGLKLQKKSEKGRRGEGRRKRRKRKKVSLEIKWFGKEGIVSELPG